EEVIARVQSVVRRRRRTTARTESKPLLAGEVEIRADRFQAFVTGASLDLTRREFELIELLAAAEGRVLEREEIYSRLWGYTMVRGDRSVDVFVRKLRQKLEKASPRWRYIHTHFGIGYRFAAESLDVDATDIDVPPSVPVGWTPGDERELARAQQLALRTVPLGHRELRGRSPARLRAEEHGVEVRSQPPQRDARGPRLALAASGQPALGVGARAVRLGLGMP